MCVTIDLIIFGFPFSKTQNRNEIRIEKSESTLSKEEIDRMVKEAEDAGKQINPDKEILPKKGKKVGLTLIVFKPRKTESLASGSNRVTNFSRTYTRCGILCATKAPSRKN